MSYLWKRTANARIRLCPRDAEAVYEGETAYLASGGGEFSAVADTLDPECVLYRPHFLMAASGAGRPESTPG